MGRYFWIGSLSLAALALSGSLASAADLPTRKGPALAPVAPAVSDILIANNQLSVDFAAMAFGYTEFSASNTVANPLGAVVDTERGWVPGVSVNWSVMRNFVVDNFYFDAELTYLNGHTNYVGSVGGGTYGSFKTNDSAEEFDTDFRLGKGFSLSRDFMLTPYVGVGSRYWSRGPNPEDYSNGYVGAGLLAQVVVVPKLVASFYGLAGGTFGSYFSTSPTPGGAIPSWSNTLGNSGIYKAGLSFDYALTGNIHLNAGLDYERFAYGMTTPYTYAAGKSTIEPNDITSNIKLKAGLGYAF